MQGLQSTLERKYTVLYSFYSKLHRWWISAWELEKFRKRSSTPNQYTMPDGGSAQWILNSRLVAGPEGGLKSLPESILWRQNHRLALGRLRNMMALSICMLHLVQSSPIPVHLQWRTQKILGSCLFQSLYFPQEDSVLILRSTCENGPLRLKERNSYCKGILPAVSTATLVLVIGTWIWEMAQTGSLGTHHETCFSDCGT